MSSFSVIDHIHMTRALRLAERGLYTTDPNPRVGCVIAHGEEVVGEGWHERAGEAHAEVLALRMAGEKAKGATAYVTLEPCSHYGRTPPCAKPLIEIGVKRVVCAMGDPNSRVSGGGIKALRDAGIEVEVGLMEAQAKELNCGFVKRMTQQLPWVRVKLGVSFDGRTALADGTSQWITGESARKDVQHWRARSSVIVTGSGTVMHDDPRMDVRDPDLGEHPRQPWRAVADGELRIPLEARMFSDPQRAVVFTAAGASPRRQEFEALGIRVESVARGDFGVDLRSMLERMAALEMNEVWVEAGSRLAGALLQDQLVDEIIAYVAPKVLGSTGLGMFRLPELSSLDESVKLKFIDAVFTGDDLRVRARPLV